MISSAGTVLRMGLAPCSLNRSYTVGDNGSVSPCFDAVTEQYMPPARQREALDVVEHFLKLEVGDAAGMAYDIVCHCRCAVCFLGLCVAAACVRRPPSFFLCANGVSWFLANVSGGEGGEGGIIPCPFFHAGNYFEKVGCGSGSDMARNTMRKERFSSANSLALSEGGGSEGAGLIDGDGLSESV